MSNPKCPHCGHSFNDEQIWHGGNKCKFPTQHDGDVDDFACPGCGVELHAQLNLTPSWSFVDEDGFEIYESAVKRHD